MINTFLVSMLATMMSLLGIVQPIHRADVGKQQKSPFAATYADPAVPILQLPTQFRTRRTIANIETKPNSSVDVLNVKGPGCVRHVWFVFAEKDIDDLEIEITVDGAEKPQVRMPFRSFFGVLLGFEDYHLNNAGFVNVPNFTVTNDPFIPKKASPGWNCYLPIPFARGCRIQIHGVTPKNGASMIDWQQYNDKTALTPLRFHAQRNIAMPATTSKPFPIVETQGTGFLAGYIMGWRQKDHRDMVFHNSGTRILMDGETDPHVISGCNVEDDFGFSWGFNQYQTQWMGCPIRDNRGRNDQDGVYYRFFGPDPVMFKSSLLFTSNARPDDYESVGYFYQVPEAQKPRIEELKDWVAVGLFPDGSDFDKFQREGGDIVQQLSQPTIANGIKVGNRTFPLQPLTSDRGWIRLEHLIQHRPAYPPVDHSYYIKTTIQSDANKTVTLRLALDDWAVVWLNGTKVTTMNHADGFDTKRVQLVLRKGANQLVIKTNNRQNSDRTIWVVNCAIEAPTKSSSALNRIRLKR